MPETKEMKSQSVTFQTQAEIRDMLERIARKAGRVRKLPKSNEVGGNISWAVNEALSFWASHLAEYQAWVAQKLADALEE